MIVSTPSRYENKRTGDVVRVSRVDDETGFPVVVYQHDGSDVEERWPLMGEGYFPPWQECWRAAGTDFDESEGRGSTNAREE